MGRAYSNGGQSEGPVDSSNAAILLFLNFAVAVGCILVNRRMLTGLHFHFPVFITFLGCVLRQPGLLSL